MPVEGGKEIYVWETSNETQSPSELEQSKQVFRNAIFLVDVYLLIKTAEKTNFQMMGQGTVADNYSAFGNEVIQRMRDPPFSCTSDCADNNYHYVRELTVNRFVL